MTVLLLALLLLAFTAIGATVLSIARDGYHRLPVNASLPRPDLIDRR